MLQYAQLPLNRHTTSRKDKNWLLSKQKNARWVLVYQDKNLFNKGAATPAFFTTEQLTEFDTNAAIYLGQWESENQHYFALELSEEQSTHPLFSHSEFVDIRHYGLLVEAQLSSILTLARGLCHWHKTHCFCGRCGHKNYLVEAGHARRCTNSQCRHITFPRTDPAVIMLVRQTGTDGVERCLLGRQASWPQGVYSTLAGFVDPAETLEQAVAREVEEETGVIVADSHYIASQPWPFPSSLMVAFIADAASRDIFVDQDELEDAQWFTREQLSQFLTWGDKAEGFKLPRKDSISRHLIDFWCAQEKKQ